MGQIREIFTKFRQLTLIICALKVHDGQPETLSLMWKMITDLIVMVKLEIFVCMQCLNHGLLFAKLSPAQSQPSFT